MMMMMIMLLHKWRSIAQLGATFLLLNSINNKVSIIGQMHQNCWENMGDADEEDAFDDKFSDDDDDGNGGDDDNDD